MNQWRTIDTLGDISPDTQILVKGGFLVGEINVREPLTEVALVNRMAKDSYLVCHGDAYSVYVDKPTHWMPIQEEHSLWGAFLNARMAMIQQCIKDGYTDTQIEDQLNINGLQTRMLRQAAEVRNAEEQNNA